jgi:hypothetical protein
MTEGKEVHHTPIFALHRPSYSQVYHIIVVVAEI